jgi:hypothetical protein
MKTYLKPQFKTFTEKDIVTTMGTTQTGYPVQFSIQAIEFQVSQNSQPTEQIFTIQDNLKDIA